MFRLHTIRLRPFVALAGLLINHRPVVWSTALGLLSNTGLGLATNSNLTYKAEFTRPLVSLAMKYTF